MEAKLTNNVEQLPAADHCYDSYVKTGPGKGEVRVYVDSLPKQTTRDGRHTRAQTQILSRRDKLTADASWEEQMWAEEDTTVYFWLIYEAIWIRISPEDGRER